MLSCKAETSVGAVAILTPRLRAGPAAGTEIGIVADPAAAAVHAGVRGHAVAGRAAEGGVPTCPGVELTNRAAVPCSQIGGNQVAEPVGRTAGAEKGLAARPIRAALVVERIADLDRNTLRKQAALATFHTGGAILLDATKIEAVPRGAPADGQQADAPRGAIIGLSRKASGCRRAKIGKSLLPGAGAGRLGRDAIKGIGALLGAPIAAASLADRIAGAGRAARRAGQVGLGARDADLWPGGRVCNASGAPSVGDGAYKIRFRTSKGRDEQHEERTRPQVFHKLSHG